MIYFREILHGQIQLFKWEGLKDGRVVLKYFWLTTMRVIYEMKILLVFIKKYLQQCHQPYTMQVSLHRVFYLEFLSSYDICIYMCYLYAYNIGLFKSYSCYVLFLSFEKPFKFYEKYF